MLFILKIIITAITLIVAVGLMLRKTFSDSKNFESSIQIASLQRSKLNESWDQYYKYFLIEVIKEATSKTSDMPSKNFLKLAGL